MADLRTAWNEAGERLSGLGLKLKLHYEQQRDHDEPARPEVKDAVKDAVKRLAEAVQDTFEAMGTAAKDPAVRDDVKQVGQSLSDALGATFAEVSEDLRRAFGKHHEGGEGAEPGAAGTGTGTAAGNGGAAGSSGPAAGAGGTGTTGAAGGTGATGSTAGSDEPPVEPWGTP